LSKRGDGQVRRSQVITTWGPGALIDLPRQAGIVGGLESWPYTTDLDEVVDHRLTKKLELMTGVTAPKLYAPPAASTNPAEPVRGIGVWRFPEWVVVQEERDTGANERSRRLVHRKALDEKGRFEGRPVVPTRFVVACARGHVADIDWFRFVHGPDNGCKRQLWLDERGTGGDLVDLVVRCECKASRPMVDAAEVEKMAFGVCRGSRPWLGKYAGEACNLPGRLLVRTAANAYFPQVLSALSLPEHKDPVDVVVAELSEFLSGVTDVSQLPVIRGMPALAGKLAPFGDDELFGAIKKVGAGTGPEPPVKQVELEALLAAPEGFGDDVPVDPEFHARRLPGKHWRRSALSEPLAGVVQLHRLREVLALTGFTRFEAVVPDTNGEYETDVERASLALEPQWFPAVENRGEGLFLQLRADAVAQWLDRAEVATRVDALAAGHRVWMEDRKASRPFPGGPYILLHTLAHLLIQSVAMRCGYPASSIRERVYADTDSHRYGLLLYTASPDAEGTLGGLVQQARHIEAHLAAAVRAGGLCSNDPVCAQHSPGEGMEGRWLHGAACHGCSLVAETSCEMRNDYLDRALVVPTLSVSGAAFFPPLA
jgi:hypothetical protein